MPRSQEPIPLKLVLDEVNELTENLHESERLDWGLQLPYIAVGYFNEKGGSLSLKEYGVHLTIPRGAVAPGSPQQVYIYVDPTAPPNDAVEPTEFALSQSVKCGPKGLRFEESVVLSFPYQADLKGHRYDKLVIRMRHGDSQERQWEDGNPALVTEKKAFVLVDHFCDFSLIGTPTPGSSKRLKIVIPEEEHMNSERLDVFRNLHFFLDSGNLAVEVVDLEGCWSIQGATEQIIDKGKIQVLKDSSQSVTFILKRQTDDSKDKGLYCAVRTYQCSPTDDSRNQAEVHLSICRNPRGGAAAPLASLKEQIGKGVSIKVHGEVEPQNFGGLSEKAVWSLCYHLDCERDGANNWRQLMQRMTDLPGRSVAVVVESGKIRAKGLLQLHFDVCRDNNTTDNEAIEFLVGFLSEMKLDEAVEIIQDDLNKRL
ncbi:netrin receptor UNC5B-a-like [Patiria miniata]|uniref:ZU5 domain-containing protein n=1 Tax=Patiria miniata TaxID=46514 RepID=A0A914AFJ8_PATMI|nr:netrin receptor UNC5B-a-like [Patiria miniata]